MAEIASTCGVMPRRTSLPSHPHCPGEPDPMSESFTLTITDTETGRARLTAVLRVDATGTHLVTVRTTPPDGFP
jgi:hypothetical protein